MQPRSKNLVSCLKADESEQWNLSKITAIWLSWIIRIPRQRTYQPISIWTINQKQNASDRTLKKVIKSTVRKKYELECRKSIKNGGSFWVFSNYQKSDARNKLSNFLNPKLSYDLQVVDWILNDWENTFSCSNGKLWD